MAIDVFEHVEDYFSFLRKLKTLTPYKIFHIPLEWTVESTLRPKLIEVSRKYLGHLHSFTKDTALAVLGDCGYNVVDWFYTPVIFELERGSIGHRMRRVALRLIGSINLDLAVRTIGGHSLLVLAE